MTAKKTSVMLPPGWPGEFTRTMRDDNGQVLNDKSGQPRVLKFQPGQSVELAADELEAVRDDIGPALKIAKVEKDNRSKPDGNATAEFVAETKALREEQKAEALKRKQEQAAAAEAAPAKPVVKPASAKGDLEKKDK